jgi:hypothetical protein
MIVNYIIPICNTKGSEYDERLKSLVFIIDKFLMKQDCQVKIIIVEQRTGNYSEFIRGIINSVSRQALANITFKAVQYPIFNKSWLYNIGMKFTEGEHCFLAESDMFTINDNLLRSVVNFTKEKNYPWCFAWNEMRYLHKKEKDFFIDHFYDYEEIPLDLKHYAVRRPSPGWMEGGPIYVRKSYWADPLVGANEMLTQLGAIDNDLCHRLKKLSNVYPKYPQLMFHLWHRDSPLKNAPSRKVNSSLHRFTSKGFNLFKINEILINYGTGNMERPIQVPESLMKELLA